MSSTRSLRHLALLSIFLPSVASALTVDFSDVSLSTPPTSSYSEGGLYYNGGPSTNSAGWASGGASFNNSFTDWGGGYSSWSGWAYSTTSDISTAGYGNQYSAFASSNNGTYAVAYSASYDPAFIELPTGLDTPLSVSVTNNTYAALSMLQGDAYSKQFGGATGTDPDWFLLTIVGKNADNTTLGSVNVYLADFRADNSAEDYVLNDWTSVDLTTLGSGVRKLEFLLSSSDNGDFGMNTPAYFALDNLELSTSAIPEPGSFAMLTSLILFSINGSRRRVSRTA